MLTKLLRRSVLSFATEDPLRVDLTRYLNKTSGWDEDCTRLVYNLYRSGFAYAYDPRIDYSKNDKYIDQMEHYFALRSRQFEDGERDIDVCVGIKCGLKENYTQIRQAYLEEKQKLKSPNISITPLYPKIDPTWRYHWLLKSESKNIIPEDFPDFAKTNEEWGEETFRTSITISEMIAIALGLEKDSITKMYKNG